MKILPKYLISRFFHLFLFCLMSVVLIVLVVDLVENFDRFIDRNVPWNISLLYYLYYIPYVVFLALPVATLMAVTFSIGNLARRNEIVAMKSLGYSLYQMVFTFLLVGVGISIFSFFLSEGVVVTTNRKKNEIERDYLSRKRNTQLSKFQNLVIQEPPDKIIFIGSFNLETNTALRVTIETIQEDKMISKVDAPLMQWDGEVWTVHSGFDRSFSVDNEKADPILETRTYKFQFTPKDLMMAQQKPDAMNILELRWFIHRVRDAGGSIQKWLTQYYIRFAFPMSSVVIILFSLPIAYNLRKKSMAIGFGISLAVCFFYFGIVQLGQTLGEKGGLIPWIAAWLGNMIMIAAGSMNLIKTRK